HQRLPARFRADVGPLDTAAAAHRSGDVGLLEIPPADQLLSVSGSDGLAAAGLSGDERHGFAPHDFAARSGSAGREVIYEARPDRNQESHSVVGAGGGAVSYIKDFVLAILNLFFWFFHDGAFWVFAVTAVAGALLVVISQNVVRMAFWLIISLGATA